VVPQIVAGRGHHFAIFVAAQWAMLPLSQAGRALFAATPPLPDLAPKRRLAESDAVDIWIARWLRIRRKDLLSRYGCDPRRLYEIWEERRFAGSRDKARELFCARYPALVDRIDYGPHRRIARAVPRELQPGLFDRLEDGAG
jgi:hypothetical protein